MTPTPWMVSMHGGHSERYCDHASSPLPAMLEAAVERGFAAYGITEHAPRIEARFLYPEEVEMGWDAAKLKADFEQYAEDSRRLVEQFAGRLEVLRGFEAEVVPADRYVELMQGLREQHGFDYIIGSVHFVDEFLFDGGPAAFDEAVTMHGGIEPLAVRYYETLCGMVESLRPEVVGHFDLIRKFRTDITLFSTPPIREAARRALEAVKDCGGILDVNTKAFRYGHKVPYPEPWVVEQASAMGIPFCFGDDSHSVDDVGTGLAQARAYLLENGVDTIAYLTRRDGGIVRTSASLS